MSWTDKDSTLPRRTWGFLILISSSKESTGERVRETYLNPNLCMSASNCGSRATRGKIRMAVFPSSDKILVSIFFSSELRWKISHPLQRCWPPFEETTFHHQLGCSKPHACRSRSTWWRPPVILMHYYCSQNYVQIVDLALAWCGRKVSGYGLPSALSASSFAVIVSSIVF